MRVWFLFCVLILPACASVTPMKKSQPDPWLGQDKFYHAIYSAGIAAVATQMSERRGSSCAPIHGIGVTVVIGTAKEIRDKNVKNKFFSLKDLFWDFVGASAGALAVSSSCHW